MSNDMRSICDSSDTFFLELQKMRSLAAQADVEFRTAASDNRRAVRPSQIEIGQPVFLHSEHNRDQHSVQGKVDLNWIGPHIVLERIQPNSFILQHAETGRKTKLIHRRMLTHLPLQDHRRFIDDRIQRDRKVNQPVRGQSISCFASCHACTCSCS